MSVTSITSGMSCFTFSLNFCTVLHYTVLERVHYLHLYRNVIAECKLVDFDPKL